MIILAPASRSAARFGLSVLMLPNDDCSATPRSNALDNAPYDRFFHPSAPLPVALVNAGVASVGSCSSSATMSVAMVNGDAPARPLAEPRVRPYQRNTPLGASAKPLSATGTGT